jgi:hypothetical protein
VKPSVTFAYEVPPGVTPDSAGETVAQVRITATSIIRRQAVRRHRPEG